MSTMSFKIYLARAGGSGEDETYALDNGVAILGFREYASLAGAKDYDDIVSAEPTTTRTLEFLEYLGQFIYLCLFIWGPGRTFLNK